MITYSIGKVVGQVNAMLYVGKIVAILWLFKCTLRQYKFIPQRNF